MANPVTGFKPSNITVTKAENPRVTNLSLPVINTEVQHVLIDGLKLLVVRNRSLFDVKFTFNSGASGTTYFTLKAGAVLRLDDISFTSKSFYVQSPGISTLEILELY